MNIYNYQDYKQILKEFIDQNSHTRGYKSRLAEACNISNSYLSQVIGSHVDLTFDQVYHMTLFFNMNEDEQEYTLTLYSLNKCATAGFKKHLDSKLQRLRRMNKDLARTIKKGGDYEASIDLISYYSSWLFPAIHIMTSIKDYQTAGAIADHLGMNPLIVKNILQQLVRMNYLSYRLGKYHICETNVHTLNEEATSIVNHKNWRMKTIQKLDNYNTEDIHYSGVHSLSTKDFQSLKDDLVEVVGRYRKHMMSSTPEEVLVHFGIDFYQI